MKKLKTFAFLLICVLSSLAFFACDKTISINSITLSETNIVLRENESKDIFVSINPENATNKNFRFVLTDDSFVDLVLDSSNKFKAKVVAKSGVIGTFTTFLQAVSEDGKVTSEMCKISVLTDKTKLFAPQNVNYDVNNQIIYWDKIDSASGYKLKIDIEGEVNDPEIICSTNSYKINEYLNKKISVQVKSLGDDIVYLDSDYSDKTFTFMQLEEPKNLSNSGNFVKFNKVENAKSYQIFVFENSIDPQAKYTYTVLDSEFNEETGYEILALQNAGKKFFVKVKALSYSEENLTVYESKCINYIEVNKIATPLVNNSNLKFNYTTNTISWSSNPNASGYKLKRYKNNVLDKEYVFTGENSNVNSLILDTQTDKLLKGKYQFTLTILGNGKNYLDSNESDALVLEKLASPEIALNKGEICWNKIENIGGYKFVIINKLEENLTQNVNSYSLASTLLNNFEAGTYQFKIASLGNGENTITSDFSQIYSFDKLEIPETPTLIDNQYLSFKVLSQVDSLEVVLTHYNSNNGVDFSVKSVITDFEIQSSHKVAKIDMLNGEYNEESYPHGNYKVYAKAYSNNLIISEASNSFVFTKLQAKQTAKVENGVLSYEKPENVKTVEAYLNGISVYSGVCEEFDINKISGFVPNREFYLQLRFYPYENTNYVISNLTEKVDFKKIPAETNNLIIKNGQILAQSSISGKEVFEVKNQATDETKLYYSLSQIKFEENNVYKIKMYFEGDDYYLNSDYSNEITVKLMSKIDDLTILDGLISFTSNNAKFYKAVLKSDNVEKIVEDISNLASYSENETKISFSLKDLILASLPIEYDKLGDNLEIFVESAGCLGDEVDRVKYSNLENKSNSVFVQYNKVREIIDLTLYGDKFSFTAVNAENYFVKLILNNNEQVKNLNTISSFTIQDNVNGKAEFLMSDLIKSVYPDKFAELEDIVEIYVYCENIKNKFEIVDDVVLFKTVDKSKSIYVNVLNSPTNFHASELYDAIADQNLINDENLGLNKLYFDCTNNVEFFEFNYTDSLGQKKTKILSLSNYLSLYQTKNNINTYQINTSFLNPDTYSFEIKSLCEAKNSLIGQKYIYNFDSFDYAKIESLTKLSAPEKIECSGQKIKIIDSQVSPANTLNAYLLVVDGKIIYDDVLGEGKDINSILQNSSLIEALSLISKFAVKERILPASYCGTMEISAIKVLIPQGLNPTGATAIQSDKASTITVTRLDTIKPVLKNGVIEWNPVKNAETYSLYKTKVENGKVVQDENNLVVKINAGEELKFDIYNYLSGLAGEYSFVMIADTAKDNFLSSLASNEINFEILQTPNLKIENGVLIWDSIANAAGYKLDIYKEGVYFDQFIYNKSVISYDAMKKSDNSLLESANYEFRITALGEIKKNSLNEFLDETVVIKSLTTNENTTKAFKLQTPLKVYVEEGLLVLTSVNSNLGVDYYNLIINGANTKIAKDKLKFELSRNYKAGTYTFACQAIGDNTCLSSNVGEMTEAEKLQETNNIQMLGGELTWDSISADNYNNGINSVKYYFSVNKEDSIYSQQTYGTGFEISKQDLVPYGLYTFEVKVLGDSNYYLNSDSAYLNNVVKLAEVKDIRIENGILTWTNPKPSDVVGLPANFKASPNGYKLIIYLNSTDKREYSISDGVYSFVLDENFDSGDYKLTIQNMGDTKSNGEYNYSNSKVVSGNVYKLLSLEDLNIQDGINLKWKNQNKKLVQDFIINISCTNNEKTNIYQGIVHSNTNSIKFEDIYYYTNASNENIIVLKSDENIISDGENLSYNGFKVLRFDGEGEIEVYVKAYGGNKYINSEKSNTITIVRPSEVKNLNIIHGLVSWDKSEDANGYILSLTRYTLNENQEKVYDEDFGNNYSLVYVNKTYYNLSDVNYYYNVSVRAYSLITTENTQTMASKPVEFNDFLFNSFVAGNGSENNPYLITNEQTLIYVKYNNVAFYKLANNINLTQKWTPLFNASKPFAGNLNGDGNSIENLTISDKFAYSGLLGFVSKDTISDDRVVNGERKEFIPEESRLRTGRVENIDFNNATISAGFNIGLICGSNDGVIYNINIRNSQIISNSEELVDTGASYKSIYSGLITATNNGRIEKISVQNDNGVTKVEPQAKTTLYSGGICAINNGEIIYGYVSVDVYGTNVGGICAINNGTIDFCSVSGKITCENYVSNKATLVACAGGICAYNNENARVSNVSVISDYFGTTSKIGISNISKSNVSSKIVYMGGLVGDNLGDCFNSFVKIDLFDKSENDVDCVLGYLFGYNKNNNVQRNKFVISTETDATQITGDKIAIDQSNCEVANHSQTMIDEFNSNNSSFNFDYEWSYVSIYEFNETIKMTIEIGFKKIL